MTERKAMKIVLGLLGAMLFLVGLRIRRKVKMSLTLTGFGLAILGVSALV